MGTIRRFGKAITGVFVGLIFILICFPLLFWNEGRAIKTAQSLEEGAEAVVSIGEAVLDPETEGELVHFMGEVQTGDRLADPKFPVESTVLALRRNVEMYQWHEEETRRSGDNGSSRSYSYHTDWADRVIDSSRFNRSSQYRNPDSMPYEPFETRATDVQVGDFKLTATFIDELDAFAPVALDRDFLADMPDGLGKDALISGSHVYISGDPRSPKVGDVRISFEVIQPHIASIIGRQQGSVIERYATEAGRDLAMVSQGRHSAQEMFEEALAENVIMTWALRIGGLIFMFVGFNLVFGPIEFVARFIPIVGRIILAAKALIAGGLTMIIGGGTIAVAWLFYRPLIGIPLVMLVFLVTFALFSVAYLKFSKQSDEPPPGVDMGTI